MKDIVITKDQWVYFNSALEIYIQKGPREMSYWLNMYRVTVQEITTITTMGVDDLTYSISESQIFLDWWNSLIKSWPEYMQSSIEVDKFMSVDTTIWGLVSVCSDLLDNDFFDDSIERESVNADLGYYNCKREFFISADEFDKSLLKIHQKRLNELYELGDRR